MAMIETMQPGVTQATDQSNNTTTTYRYETTYSGNTGNDLGISTAGYRTGKHNPEEWHSANYRISYQSAIDRDKAMKVGVIILVIINFVIIILCWHAWWILLPVYYINPPYSHTEIIICWPRRMLTHWWDTVRMPAEQTDRRTNGWTTDSYIMLSAQRQCNRVSP